MKRFQQPWEEKLHDFLREDRNLLLEHGKLIKKLRPFVSGDAMKDFRSVEKALNSNIGEVLLAAEESGELERRAEAVQDVRNQLLGSGMQEKRVNYAIDVIQNALEWDREHQNMATESRESVATEKNQVSNGDVTVETSVDENVWVCLCGANNSGRFCTHCGRQNPTVSTKQKEIKPPQERIQKPTHVISSEVPKTMGHASENKIAGTPYGSTASNASSSKKALLGGFFILLLVVGAFLGLSDGKSKDSTGVHSPSHQGQQETDGQILQNNQAITSSANNVKPKREMVTDLSLGELDLGLTIDQVHKILGKENSTKTEGNYKFFLYDHVKVGVKDGVVHALVSVDSKAETKRGLHEGSTYADVKKAYGTDSSNMELDELLLYEYTYESLQGKKGLLRFAINKSDNRVNYISVRIPEEPAKPKVDIDGAKQAFIDYHKAITDKDFNKAYSFLSKDRRSRFKSVNDFSSGYKTTISSTVDGLTIASSTPKQVIMYYNLIARDKASGNKVLVRTFGGTATMILEEGNWRLSEAESKKTGERME